MPSPQANPTIDHAPEATTPNDARDSAAARSSGAGTDHGDAPPNASADPVLRHERFCIGDKLGEGGMGVVYRASTPATAARSP